MNKNILNQDWGMLWDRKQQRVCYFSHAICNHKTGITYIVDKPVSLTGFVVVLKFNGLQLYIDSNKHMKQFAFCLQ